MADPLPQRRTVAVVGGGVAGLLAARRRAARGDVVTILEATESLGGRVSRIEVDGLELDAGAESFATRGGSVERLLAELGLSDAVAEPSPTPAWVVGRGVAHALPASGWMGVPTDPFAPDVVAAIGRLGSLRLAMDRWLPVRVVAPDATAAGVFRRRLGRRATARLVGPVVRGIYSKPLDALPFSVLGPDVASDLVARGGLLALAAARRAAAPAGAAVLGLEGGVATLAEALGDDARRLGVAVRTGVRVTEVRAASGVWEVETGVDAAPIRVDEVVIAVPPAAAARIAPAFAPTGASTGRAVLVTLVLDAPMLDAAPRGNGVLALPGLARAKALTHATAKWPWLAARTGGRHVVRLSYDASACAGLDEGAPAEAPGSLAGAALADASALLGVPLGPPQLRDIAVVSWPDSSPLRDVDARPAPGLTLVGSAAGLSGIAAIVAADFVLSDSQERMTA
ncbi:NAD(P)/FAD-dependent oxidoreductase [Demequina sp. NBRC 110052]|uniref:protoporphyrinogen/coproporphyrinogen oxidase n=1 Tax=Demequina sp. NBRC 110052 TaxID=1570341 RepID=UPI000A0627EC|nr:FAD-dependent oxidoreductase [Demequina sp. NBRC 110052]